MRLIWRYREHIEMYRENESTTLSAYTLIPVHIRLYTFHSSYRYAR